MENTTADSDGSFHQQKQKLDASNKLMKGRFSPLTKRNLKIIIIYLLLSFSFFFFLEGGGGNFTPSL